MKQKRLASLLTLVMSFELMVSPLIPHVRAADDAKTEAPKKSSMAETTSKILGAVGQVYNQFSQQNNMNTQMSGDMGQLRSQQTPQPDKYFNLQKLSMIPGLGQYLALNNINPQMLNCSTLPTTLFEAKPEVCRIGITGDRGVPPPLQMQQMFTYYNQYFQIEKLYKNYQADSNSDGQAFGVGCMNNAMNILNGFFKYRMDELDKLTTNLEALNNQFREASRADLDAIEEAVAVLDGDSPIADKVKSKKPDLFDYAKRFNNPACNSMFAGDKLNNIGREGGLNKIKADMKDTLSTKGKNGKYSGESYSQMHAAVVEDLNSLADKVSKQFSLNFNTLSKDASSYGKFLSALPDFVSSTTGANQALTPDLFSDVQTKFNESFLKLTEQKSTVLSELNAAGVKGDVAANLLGNTTSSNFDAEVYAIENKLKNNCLDSTLSSMNRDKLMDKIYDPTASRHANKHASNFLKDKLNQILDNKETSLAKKLDQLKLAESQSGNRYYMNMENSYEVQEVDANGVLKTTVVGASTKQTPGIFFSHIIRNCEAQFKANKLDSKMTGASAIQKLKQLNQDYKNLAATQASDMKKEVRKKMIECTSPEIANNTTPGSCTPDRFDTSSAGFCANAAFSCSKNMQACTQQADKFVQEIKGQKTARVNNYKNLLKKNKADIVKIFDSALTRYMKDGEALRGIFGAGFSSPAGIQREVPENERYLSEFQSINSVDGKLLLEDPDKYVEMFKKNIALLKDSVKKQQDQILGGDSVGKSGGLLAEHIKKTQKNYQAVERDASKLAEDCRRNHDDAIKAAEAARNKAKEEELKKNQELGEKQREYCRRFNLLANNHPGPACKGNIEDLVSAVGSASRQLEIQCDGLQNESSTNSISQAQEICISNGLGLSTFDNSSDPDVRAAQRKLKDLQEDLEDARDRKKQFAVDADTTKIDKEIKDFRDQVATAETELASKKKSASNSASSNSNDNARLSKACETFVTCYNNNGTESTSTSAGKNGCTDEKLSSASVTVLRLNGDTPPVPSMEEAPAFCTGGDNSNRGDPMKGFMNGLNGSSLASGAGSQ